MCVLMKCVCSEHDELLHHHRSHQRVCRREEEPGDEDSASASSRILVAGCQEQQSECCFVKFHLGRVNNSHFYKLEAYSFKLISQFSWFDSFIIFFFSADTVTF